MISTRRPAASRTIRVISLTLCYSLIASTAMLPLTPSVTAEINSTPLPPDVAQQRRPEGIESFGSLGNLALGTWNYALSLLGGSQQENDGMPTRPLVPPRQEPKSPPTRSEKEARVFRIQINLDPESWIASKQRFLAGALPLDQDGNAVHGLGIKWTTSDKQVVFVNREGKAVAGHPGVAHLTAQAGNKRESVKINVYDGGGQDSAATSIEGRQPARRKLLARSQRGKGAFAHAPMPTAPYDLLDSETSSLYQPKNDVGKPPGRTEAGALALASATSGTETPGSANYTFGVPLLSIPGRQLNVGLGLAYNSRVWHKVTASTTKMYFDVDSSWPAPGFRLGYGQLENQGTAGYTLTEPNGTRRQMTSIGSNQYRTTDGSLITYNSPSSTVSYPDGTQVVYGATNGPRKYPGTITDRNGNQMFITYVGGAGPKIANIKDSLSRYILFYYSGNDLIAITAPGYNGGSDRQIARFYYETLNLPSGLFQGGTVTVISPTSARILRYVYLPGTQNGYRYDYSAYGMIYKTFQLRGMTVGTTSLSSMGSVTSDGDVAATTEYNYPLTAQNLTDAPKYSTRTDDWAGRTTASASIWTFTADDISGLSTVTSPAPESTVTETQTDPETGQLQSVTLKYQSTVLAKTGYSWQGSTGGIRLTKLETTDDANQTRATSFTYDAATIYNNVTSVSERDFAAPGTLGTELRRTETTYENSTNYTNRGLIHLPKTVKVFAGGSSTPSSLVSYTYDGGTLLARSGIDMYDPTYNPSSPSEEEVCDWVWNGHFDEWVCWAPFYNPATAYRGNLTSVTAYANAAAQTGATTDSMSYDIAGNVVEQTANCCRKKTYGYSDVYDFGYVTSQTRGETGQLSSSGTYDFNTGVVRTTVSENNRTTTIHYDPASLRTSEILRPVGATTFASTTFFFYDRLLNDPDAAHKHSYVLTTTQRNASSSVVRYQFLDGRGAVARSFSEYVIGQGYVTQDVEYDQVGRVLRSGQPYYSLGSAAAINPSGLWTTNQFDKLGRVTSVTWPSGDSGTTTSSASVAYAGTVTTTTDAALRQRRQVTDALGRMLNLDEPDMSGNLGTVSSPTQRTTYEYDPLDNLTKITQGSQVRQFKYDSLSQLTHEKQIEANATLNGSGTYVGGSGSWTGVFVYNNFGLMTDSYDARGVRTQLSYDTLNRLKTITNTGESTQTPTVTYTYGDEITPTPPADSKGRLSKLETATVGSTPTTAQEYDYSVAGRVVTQREKIGSTTYTLGYVYNYLGQATSCTHPSGRVISYGFDAAARLISVGDSANRISASGFAYAAHGGLTAETWGNGAVENVSYNRGLQPKSLSLTKSGEVQKFDYKYGVVDINNGTVDESKNSGQVARVEGFIGPTASPVKQWQQRYTYDSVNRLSKAKEIRGDNGVQAWQVAYTHDRWGNRFQSGSDNSGIGYTPVLWSDINTAKNQFISTGSTPTTYDDAGQITSDNKFRGMQYQYDANGRMRWAARLDGTGASSSVYDGGGRRVQTTLNGATRNFIYNLSGQIVAEYRQGVLDREYVYQSGALLATDEQPRTCSLTTDQFVQAFYSGVLNRQPNGTELPQKSTALNQAMAQGYGPLLAQAQALGTALFTSQEYLNRNRTNSEFITDLYWGYLQRAPDQGGFNWWLGILQSPPNTRESVRQAFAVSGDFQILVAGICTSLGGAAMVKYVFMDHQGSTRALMDGTGNVISRHDYLPFGEELWAGTGMRTATQKFGAMDQSRMRYGLTEKDEATGLDHTWWRKYENASGRWTTPDPLAGAIADPQRFNRYSYVRNTPINAIDPSGLQPQFCLDINIGDGITEKVCFGSWYFWFGHEPRGAGNGYQKADPCAHLIPANVPEGVSPDADIQDSLDTQRAMATGDGGDLGSNSANGAYPVVLFMAFYNRVRAGGSQDYKLRDPEGIRKTGRSKYEEYGNFTYGAVGAAEGIPTSALLRGAGLAQQQDANPDVRAQGSGVAVKSWTEIFGDTGEYPFGDELQDAQAIMRGIEYYDCRQKNPKP